MQNKVNTLKYKPLSETDIKSFLGGRTRIVKYSQINAVTDIDQLVEPYGNCVILLETEPEFGHWICLKKNVRPNFTMISFFDSYGGFPDKQKHYVGKDFLAESGQKYNKLCELLYYCSYNNRYLVEFSHRKFQNIRDPKMATCGHWCSVFIKSNLTIKEFNEYIDKYQERNLDNLVVKLYYNMIPKLKKRKMNTEEILKD